jgi:23S rRNA pseudouridine2605 synthase
MTDNVESEPVMPNPDEAPRPKKRKTKAEPAIKSEATTKTKAKPKAESRATSKTESKTKSKPASKARTSKARAVKPTKLIDPIGDVGDGEAASATGSEPASAPASELAASTGSDAAPVQPVLVEAAEPASSALPAQAESDEDESGTTDEGESAPRPPRKLERLQKILAQAGIASRRSAEALITDGRVQVNGKVVTQLGSKADAAQDHIRVDGKLLHGAERQRYFVLNKPKGFVTTVKDPEGRPTVMQFFEKMPERLYPVGRLDYQTEGLLLVTNDGELANKLTKAASGVEKTYLVKVSGQPSEGELDILRGGVSIERGKPGEGRVRTAPARIRQVRQGDNPWYEVVLIEGRNRELRKMFEEIGHFVEKIRRVGYGPLVLDQEPGKLRELDPQELSALRLAAEGKLRTPKAKELRRRNALDAQLPTLPPRPTRLRPGGPFPNQSSSARAGTGSGTGSGTRFGAGPGARSVPTSGARPDARRSDTRPETRPDARSGGRFGARSEARPAPPSRPGAYRPQASFSARPDERPHRGNAGAGSFGTRRPDDRRPAWKKDDRGARGTARPPARPEWNREAGPGRRPPFDRIAPPDRTAPPAQAGDSAARRPSGLRIDAIESDRPGAQPQGRPSPGRPPFDRAASARPPYARGPQSERPGFAKPGSKPRFDKPRFDKPKGGSDRPRFDKPRAGFAKPAFAKTRFDKPGFAKSDRPGFQKSGPERPRFDGPRSDRPRPDRFQSDRPGAGRSTDFSQPGRPGTSRAGTGGSGPGRPFRGEGGLARPFTTSSGKPRAGGARPGTKPGKSGGGSYGPGSRPARAAGSGPRPGGRSSWKPKPGGPAHKAKPTGGKRGGPPGGKKRK